MIWSLVVWIAMLAVCVAVITSYVHRIEEQQQMVKVLLADPMEASYVHQMASQEKNQVLGQEIVFLHQDRMAQITSPDMGDRSVWTEVIGLCGKSSILFDSSMGLEYNDTDCCLLSYGAAYDLFGIEEVSKGTLVVYRGEKFKVVGSIPSTDSRMVYEVSRDMDILFDTAVIDNRTEKDVEYLLEQFGVQWGPYMQIR